jgi:hypothetical protein
MRNPRLVRPASGGFARAAASTLPRLSRYPTRTAPAVPGQTDNRLLRSTTVSGPVSCALTAFIDAVGTSQGSPYRQGIVPRPFQLAESRP